MSRNKCISRARFSVIYNQIRYGGKSAKGFSAKYFQRRENSEKRLSERIFELRPRRVQSVGEGEMYFRCCAFRAFFFAERVVRSNTVRWIDTIYQILFKMFILQKDLFICDMFESVLCELGPITVETDFFYRKPKRFLQSMIQKSSKVVSRHFLC
jgi:hypothetical protein